MSEAYVVFWTILAIIAFTWCAVCGVFYLFRLERDRPLVVPRFTTRWDEEGPQVMVY